MCASLALVVCARRRRRSLATMASCIPAAACGHTASDAVVCLGGGGEDCVGSACPACADDGREELLLGEEVMPGGVEVFLPGFEGFFECKECKRRACEECYGNGLLESCEKCGDLFCEKCQRSGGMHCCEWCSISLCKGCNDEKIVACASCEQKQCAKHHKRWLVCRGCHRHICRDCFGEGVQVCSDDSCQLTLCSACFTALDPAQPCASCAQPSVCAEHFLGEACQACGLLSCYGCLTPCKGCSQLVCDGCLASNSGSSHDASQHCAVRCDACAAVLCGECSRDVPAMRWCASCQQLHCAACHRSAAGPACDGCGASAYACWRCRADAYRTCVACLGTQCAGCCAEGAAGGGGGGGAAGGAACALCEAFRCAPCAARVPLVACAACAAPLCSGCVPRHRCSAAKRARAAE